MSSSKSNNILEFICEHCGKTFYKTEAYVRKNKGVIPKFCSHNCFTKHRTETHTATVVCKQCGKEFRIQMCHINPYGNFCSQSCAATYTNSHRSREVYNKQAEKLIKNYNPEAVCVEYDGKIINENKICPECGGLKSLQSLRCKKCESKRRRENIFSNELGYYIDNQKYLTTKLTEIRKNARRVLTESTIEKVCHYCHNHEYDEILEVHHIKGILEFPRDAKIGEINNIDNLVWLCPNHHAMVERGLIKL